MDENMKRTTELLRQQVENTIDAVDEAEFCEDLLKPRLEKLNAVCTQYREIRKLDDAAESKALELEIERLKLESETAIKIRDLDLRAAHDKATKELEEAKLKEQKRSTTTQAVVGGVTAATGIAGLIATVHCFNKSLQFETTGSFTSKSGNFISSIKNLFKRH